MSASARRTGRKLLLAAVTLFVCMLAVEGLTRLLIRGPRWIHPDYVKVSSGYEELDALIDDTQRTFSATQYYDEFLYAAAPVTTAHVTYTDYYSARRTPDSAPLSEAQHIVWTFGGSTMANTETTDSLTIANTWARIFNRELGPTHVKNFGTGSLFSSYELIKFQKLLREVKTDELPTMAIFYDGYNDSVHGFQYGPGSLQKDLSLKLEAFIEHEYLKIWTYSLSEMLERHSEFWERTGARGVEYLLFRLPPPRVDAEILSATVRVYTSNVRMAQATCGLFHVRCFFVLQPLLMTKTPLGPLERGALASLEAHPRFGPEGTRFVREFYALASGELADDESFIDASHVLDGRTQDDFYDIGHVSAQTPPVIGGKIATMILARLASGPTAKPDSANGS